MDGIVDKLFGQALDEAVPETWTTLDADQLSRLKDKFAELIVRECIAITNDQYFAYEAVEALHERFGEKQ